MKGQTAIQGALMWCPHCKISTKHDEYLVPQNFRCRSCQLVRTVKGTTRQTLTGGKPK